MTSAIAYPTSTVGHAAASRHRYVALDALRGIAALMVVIGHQTSGAFGPTLFIAFYLAVDFFFVLSGFVLAHRYWGDLTRYHRRFLPVIVARFARLYPAHVFVLFALLLTFGIEAWVGAPGASPGAASADGASLINTWATLIPPYEGGPPLSTFVLNLLLLQNVGLTPTGLTWNIPSWSISVEFFGSLAVLALIAAWRGRGLPMALALIAGCGYALVLSQKSGILDATYETLWHVVNLGLVRAIAGIALGAVTLLVVRRYLAPRAPGPVTATAIELLAILCALAVLVRAQYHDTLDGFFPLAAVVVVAVFSLEAGAIGRLLRLSPLAYLGSLSYAIYLVHWPLLYIMVGQYKRSPAAYYPAVFAAAILTHHAIEVPARRFIMRRWGNGHRA